MRIALLATVAVITLASIPAWAQSPDATTATDLPPPLAVAQGAPVTIQEAPHAPPSAEDQRLNSMRGSGATGADSIGILPLRITGFDRKTWRDTPFPLVLELLNSLPYRIDSAAEHMLARNLLVSVADVPPGDDGSDQLLVRRVEHLSAFGNVQDAAALARAAPSAPSEERLARAEIDAELLAGQIEAACIDIRAFASAIATDWLQTGLLLCRQRDGEPIEGGIPELNVDILGPLVRIAGHPIPANPEDAAPARLVAAAYEQKMPPELRVEAAYAAGRASALDGDKLAVIFRRTPATGELPADGGPPTDGNSAALLFHAIEAAADPIQKLALVERGLLSPTGGLDKVGVAMVSPLRDIQPSEGLSAYAARFAALFYAIGDVETAMPWAEIAERTGQAGALWPYRVVLKQADALGIAEWQDQSGLDPANAARIKVILAAFGITRAPPGSQHVAGEDRPEASLADLMAMDQSARDLHVGETVLRALAILGKDGPALAHPLALGRSLADLDNVNMHDEAHALAFEAIAAVTMGHAKRP